MEEIKISQFKATCLAVLDQVARTGTPILVTRFGKPVAQVCPSPQAVPKDWLGSMKDSGRIHGDLVPPAMDASSWEALD